MCQWNFYEIEAYRKRRRHFDKKHQFVLVALFHNLAEVQSIFEFGDNPRNIVKHPKVRNERHGLYAVDQRGATTKIREARLYFYPDFENQRVYLIYIGFKSEQQKDLRRCHEIVKCIKKEALNG